MALDRVFRSGLDLPVGREAAEVVEPHHIEQRHVALHAPDPPGVVLRAVYVPVIHRIAPELTGGRIVVGRHARDQLGAAVGLELEQRRVRPHIRGVCGNVDRDIPDDLDAFFIGVGMQRVPLLEKTYCRKMRKSISSRSSAAAFSSAAGLRSRTALSGQKIDRHIVVFFLFKRHKQRIIRQPGGIFLTERGDLGAQRVVNAAVRLAEQRPAGIRELFEIRLVRRRLEVAGPDSAGVNRPSSTSRSRSIRYGLPAAAEKH